MNRPKRPTDEGGSQGPPSRRGRMTVSLSGSSRSSRGQPSPDELTEMAAAFPDPNHTGKAFPNGLESVPDDGLTLGLVERPSREDEGSSSDRVAGFKALSLSPSTKTHPPTNARLYAATSSPGPILSDLFIGPSSQPSGPSSSTTAPPLLRLQADVYHHLFPFLPSRDLARLAQTSRFFRDRIAAWHGFNSVVLVAPQPASSSSPTAEYSVNLADGPQLETVRAVSGSLPPAYPFRGSVVLGGKVYLPWLDDAPCCYVLDVATLFWSRHPLKAVGPSPFAGSETPRRPSSRTSSSTATIHVHHALAAPVATHASSSSIPDLDMIPPSADPSPTPSVYSHTGPVTGVLGDLPHSTAMLYMFGGSRTASSTPSPPSSSDSPTSDPPTSEDSASSGSLVSGQESSSSFYRIDVATWELHDMRIARQSSPPSSDDASAETRLWPAPRRNHSADVVRGKWLVVFGGLEARGSTGENDLWVYDLVRHEWHHPDLSGWAPRPVFSHSSLGHKDDLFVFGGTQKDHPTNLVLDTLSRLSCVGPPSRWAWHSYRPSESFTYPRSARSQAPRDTSTSTGGDSSSHEPASSQSESSSSGAAHAAALSSSYGSSSGGTDPRDPRANQGSSGGSSSGSEGRNTTGSSPLERFQAGMLMVGSDKLVILGGNTIEDGYDTKSGMPYDDVCTFNLPALDIFDVTRLHWSRIRPPVTLDKKPVFFSEAVYAAIPPDIAAPLDGWKILASGKALDLDDLYLTVVSSEEGSSSSAADASFESSGGSGDGNPDPSATQQQQQLKAESTETAGPPALARSGEATAIRVDDLLSTSPPPPHLALSSGLGPAATAKGRRPRFADRSPSEERVKLGGYISLYKRNESLLTASAYARLSVGSGERLSSSEDSDSNETGPSGASGSRSSSRGTRRSMGAMAIPSKVTTCVVVFT